MLRDRKVRRERTALSRTWRSVVGGLGQWESLKGRGRGEGKGNIPLWTSCLMNGLLGAADCAIFAVTCVDVCVTVMEK